jgi:hypothetical protein
MYQLIMTALLTLSFSLFAQAQDVGVKVNNIDATQDTTISIKKGDATTKKKWILTEDEEDITGNKDVVMKNAEKNWMTACKEWKAEFKEMNKENKIVAMNCGKMSCSKEGVESTCTSKAKYKVKTISEE